MHPVWQQGPDGQLYSCAMSAVDRQQGFINGIPYCSASFIPVCNGVTGVTSFPGLPNIQGCCVKIYPTANRIIDVPPRLIKGYMNSSRNLTKNHKNLGKSMKNNFIKN